MNPFFITGLPRSRTAWFANLFTHKDSYCFHEATLRCNTPDDLRQIMQSRPEKYVGNSDSGIPLFWNALNDRFPFIPVVVVQRDIEDAMRSYQEAIDQNITGIQIIHDCLPKVKGKNVINVDFNDLSNEDTIKRIWRHCVPDVPFDSERWAMLEALRVSVIPERVAIPQPGMFNYIEV